MAVILNKIDILGGEEIGVICFRTFFYQKMIDMDSPAVFFFGGGGLHCYLVD